MPERSVDRRRTFVPVVALGVAGAGLAALAGSRPWVTGDGAAPGATATTLSDALGAGEMPLAGALGLVVLACWGVVLVTRRVVRRAAAALAVLGSAGLAVTVVVGSATLPDQMAAAMREVGAEQTAISVTGWFWATALAAAVSLLAATLATAWCPSWPEMSSRYDAPGDAEGSGDDVPPEERSNLDLWKQLDEGRDPTT